MVIIVVMVIVVVMVNFLPYSYEWQGGNKCKHASIPPVASLLDLESVVRGFVNGDSFYLYFKNMGPYHGLNQIGILAYPSMYNILRTQDPYLKHPSSDKGLRVTNWEPIWRLPQLCQFQRAAVGFFCHPKDEKRHGRCLDQHCRHLRRSDVDLSRPCGCNLCKHRMRIASQEL